MEGVKQIWDILLWGFGICATGFFLLAGWMWWIVQKLNGAVALQKNIENISQSIKKIEDALLGDYQHKGIISRHYDLERRIEVLEQNPR